MTRHMMAQWKPLWLGATRLILVADPPQGNHKGWLKAREMAVTPRPVMSHSGPACRMTRYCPQLQRHCLLAEVLAQDPNCHHHSSRCHLPIHPYQLGCPCHGHRKRSPL